MTTLHNILSDFESKKHATDIGTETHRRLRRVTLCPTSQQGNPELIKKILQTPNLPAFFSPESRTEVPIAGTINNTFISRRIDRLLINHTEKTIQILDYKTDITPELNRNSHYAQIHEYKQLLHLLYPDYAISGYILWTHDFLLEKTPDKPL